LVGNSYLGITSEWPVIRSQTMEVRAHCRAASKERATCMQ